MARQGAVLYIGAVENLLGRPRIEGINNKKPCRDLVWRRAR